MSTKSGYKKQKLINPIYIIRLLKMSTEGVATLKVLLIIINADDYTIFLEKDTEETSIYRFPCLQYQTECNALVIDSVYNLHTNICRDIRRTIDMKNDSLSISIGVHIKDKIHKVKDNNEVWVTAKISDVPKKIERNSNVKWIHPSSIEIWNSLISDVPSSSPSPSIEAFISIFGGKTVSFEK